MTSVSTTQNSESESADSALLRSAREGSNSSLGELFHVYRNYLLQLADEELGSDIKVKGSASDLVQESFLEAKRDFPKFAGSSLTEFQAWLRRILLNNVANMGRSFRETQKRDITREISISPNEISDPLGSQDGTVSSIVVKNELLDAIQIATRNLPAHYQEVIRLRNYERESFESIGQKIGRTTEAARKLWVRALEQLQHELDFANDSVTINRGNGTGKGVQ